MFEFLGQVLNNFIGQPLINVLAAIYQVLAAGGVPHALGFSIIVLTILVRFLIYPLMSSQLKHSKKMQELAPHTVKIKEKHKGDMRAQQEATMALYREHGFNPAAGCVPVLIQFPLLIGLYTALQKVVGLKTVDEVNKLLYADPLKLEKLWDTSFFGLPLGKTPEDLLPTTGVGILLVVVITGLLQFVQSKMMAAPKIEENKNLPVAASDNKPDFGSMMQTQMLYMLPIFIGAISYKFSIGLSLYWNTFTLFGIIQQYRVGGWGGWIKRSDNK